MDGELLDLTRPLAHDCALAPVSLDSPEGLEIMRHSAAHIMAEAVRGLFPEVKVTIGPAIEAGFYYDFDVPTPFIPEDLPKIEAHMEELVAQDQPFTREEVETGTKPSATFSTRAKPIRRSCCKRSPRTG